MSVALHRASCRVLRPRPQLAHQAVRHRSAGRKTTVAYEDLSDSIAGAIPLPPIQDNSVIRRTRKKKTASPSSAEDEPPKWPPLAQAVLADMDKFPDCILLTKVGGFYESYFHQAPQLASMLGIKLANRRWAGQDVPMAGFPIFQLEKYLKILVLDKRLLVAIAEEFRTGELAHNQTSDISRRVNRVVSAGTLIDEKFLDPFRNNFIASISVGQNTTDPAGSPASQMYGLAWLDVGTADFQTATCNDLETLRDEIARISPRELVVEERHLDRMRSALQLHGSMDDCTISTISSEFVDTRHQVSSSKPPGEDQAVQTLLEYLKTRLIDDADDIDSLTRAGPLRHRDDLMQIDAQTLSALEIRETSREGGIKGSLFSTIRRTVTRGGTRLLQQWLTAPSTDLAVIQARLDLVDIFRVRPFLKEDLRSALRTGAGDVSRVLQRAITRRSNAEDLLEIRDFITACERIVSKLREEASRSDGAGLGAIAEYADRFNDLTELGDRLEKAIDERVIELRSLKQEAMAESLESAVAGNEAGLFDSSLSSSKSGSSKIKTDSNDSPILWGDGFEHLIRPSTSRLLTTLTDALKRHRRSARKLEEDFKEAYGDHVSLRYVLGQGFVVHARGKPANDPDKHLNVAGKLRSTHTYYAEKWTLMGSKMHKTIKEMKDAEALELEQLRQDVLTQLTPLRWNARLLDQLDVLLGYAQAAEELKLVRPTVDDSLSFEVVGGRHLSVEMGLLEQQRLFTKNDLTLDADKSRLHLITGPNMGGKSTFLRQNAMIAILAQAGSFVPADAARVGIVDRVFSRIGAKDDLFRDRSTFMVEMMEASEILRRATHRSMVIADEIGRGTTTDVGVAIAFAVLHELYETNRARTLFATHFHELADMLASTQMPGIACFCTDVHDDEVCF